MSLIAEYNLALSTVIKTCNAQGFPAAIAELLRTLVESNDITLIIYRDTAMPQIEFFMSPEGESNLDMFRSGVFLIDPFYLAAAKDNKSGFYALKELTPKGFKNSEYFKTWYRHSGLHDECGYLIPIDGGFINLSVGRTDSYPKFNKALLTFLAEIEPTISALCQRHYNSAKPAANLADDDRLPQQLQTALDNFGSSVLTDREQQVVNMLMHGHSTKSVAEILCISTETVKLHRKKSYAKLDINSQSELFYLFIDSLMSVKSYQSGDTLISYL
jgi:DNA-binding CsgD family transcriptional regulator